MKRAVIYARVSTDEQRGNYSIGSQLDSCNEYIKRKGYFLIGNNLVNPKDGMDTTNRDEGIPAYVDDFTSRELNRPGLDEVLSLLESKGFDVLVVHSIDRLARDPYIRKTLELEFESFGAVVEYATGNYESTPEGEVRKDLEATFGKWENAIRVERSNRGKRKKAEQGLYVGGGRTPYGYIYDPSAKPGGLLINQTQAEVVKLIFDLYVNEGVSIRGIAKRLNHENGAVPALGGNWYKSTVGRILRNTAYVGYIFYNKHKSNGYGMELRDEEDWIKIEIPPIITLSVFQKVQQKLDANKQISKRKPIRVYLLSGMIFCDECGRFYIAQTALAGRNRRKNEGRSYRHRKKEGHCFNKQISARKIEPIVWSNIVEFLLDPTLIRVGYEKALEEEKSRQGYKMKLQLQYIETLEKFEEKKHNLISAYTDPEITITKSEYIESRDVIDKEIEGLQKRIHESEDTITPLPTSEELESLERFASEIRSALLDNEKILTLKDKKHILELLQIKVFIGRDGTGRIESWYQDAIGFSSQTSGRCDHL